METIYSYVETSESNVIPTKDLTQNIKKAVGNKIFTVNFFTKNFDRRQLTGRLNVVKYCGTGKPTVDLDKYLVVFEMNKKQYRNVNVKGIAWIKFQNKKWMF